MKKVILIKSLIVTITILSSCNGQSTEEKTELKSIEQNKKTQKNKMTTIHLTKEEFATKIMDYTNNPTEWKYLGNKPAIIDFYADWCAPCRMVAPSLEELAEKYNDEIYIYKVDTEKEQELAAMFGIRSLPSILFIPMEGQPQMTLGALPKEELENLVKTILLKK